MVNDSDPRGLPFAALVAARAASVAARNAAVRRAVVRGATWVVVNGGSTPETCIHGTFWDNASRSTSSRRTKDSELTRARPPPVRDERRPRPTRRP